MTKGIGILLVVVFHVWRGIVEAGLGLSGRFGLAADYAVYLFHMPLFFVISGLFVNSSLKKGTGRYLSDKLLTVYYPYLLWSTISILLAAGLSGAVNNPVKLERLLLVPAVPKFHFWFLLVLFLYYLITVIIRDLRTLSVLAVAATFLHEIPYLRDHIGPHLHFFAFFVAGMLVRPLMENHRFTWWPVALTVLAGSAVAGYWNQLDTQSAWLVPAGLAGTYLTIGMARVLADHSIGKALRYLGERSLAIYLMHIIASSGTRIILIRLWPDTPAWLIFVPAIAIGIIAPLVAYSIAERLRLLTLAGLGRDAPRDADASTTNGPATSDGKEARGVHAPA